MLLGYNTNGFAHHELIQAIEVLADIGYQSVAITLDHAALNPFGTSLPREIARVSACLERHSLQSVIETGARFLLDPRCKHEPTLLADDADARRRRVDFLCRSIEIAAELGSTCISIWSGRAAPSLSDAVAWQRLVDALQQVLDVADKYEVQVGFEPEPGMFVAKLEDFERLLERIDAPQLRLTLDVGHLQCQAEFPLDDHVRRWAPRIANVHIEDMRQGIHEHLMFGEGEIDFLPIISEFVAMDYAGGLHVELSRHSHEAPTAARRAYRFLDSLLKQALRRT
jgi:sugar phosphate isomerase/epimerase